MALPQFRRTRPLAQLADNVRRLEEAVATYAQALTGERGGLLSRGLTVRENAKGRVYSLAGVTPPDGWVTLSLSSPFSNFGGAYSEAAVQKTPAGTLKLRGLLKASAAPAANALIATLPTGYATGTPQLFGQRTNTGQGEIRVEPDNTIRWQSGGTTYISLGDIPEWDAADRSPPAWPTASQPVLLLGENYPGTPEVVRVEDAVTEAGVHLGPCAAEWEAETVGGRRAIRLRRIAGLSPGVSYTLTLAVLAA